MEAPTGSIASIRQVLRSFKLWLQALVLKLLLVSASTVVLLNLGVRHIGGGNTRPVSLERIPEKSRAMGKLALHMLTHPLRTDEEDPRAVVAAEAVRNGVNPDLALAVAKAESAFYPHAISSTGAMGLMQLMPATARAYLVRDPFDIRQNADGGTRLLNDLLQHYRGDARRALAAYNAGTARVPRRGPYRVPRSTRAYVSKILND